ncbi:MAG: response regulator [Proteobacteria bacterium]|nr:response regulator [Pseudomonadota bacterium]
MESRIRLLAVDDDPEVLRNLAMMLSLEGYYVMTASSGMEALGLLNEYRYDVVITNLRMPVVDGYEIVCRVQSLMPQTAIIVTSSYLDAKTQQWIRDRGVRGLEKPYDVFDVSALLQQFQTF